MLTLRPAHRPRRSAVAYGRAVAVSVATAMLVTACSSAPPAPTAAELAASQAEDRLYAACQRLSQDVAARLQAYVDQFAPIDETAAGALEAGVPDTADLAVAAEQFRVRRASLACQPREFQLLLTIALADVEGNGALGQAVAAQVRDAVLETPGPTATVTVEPGDDLAAAVHDAGPRAEIRLAAGTYRLDESLVLLRDTTLIGAGPDATFIVSSAPGAAVLNLGAGHFTAEGISFTHEGDDAASVLVLATGDYDLYAVSLTGGVADDALSSGFGLVLGGGPDESDGERTERTERLQDVIATGNGAGGIVVAGDRAPAMVALSIYDNAGCGICWVGASGGSLADSTITGNVTGVSVADSATPTVTDTTVQRNTAAGMVVDVEATLRIERGRVTDNGVVGLAATGSGTLVIDATVVGQHTEVGILTEGQSMAQLTGVELSGSPVSVLAREASDVTARNVVSADATDAHIVFSGSATGLVDGGTCAGSGPKIVLLEDSTADTSDAGCDVIDQR
jgi:hypothetical protein